MTQSVSSAAEQAAVINALLSEVAIFHVSIGFPRFNKKMTPEELGLDPSQVDKTLHQLGCKKLLGPQTKDALDAFKKRAGRVEQYLASVSRPFVGDRVIPFAKVTEVWEKLKEEERGQAEDAMNLIVKYPELKEQALAYWREWTETSGVFKAEDEREGFMARLALQFPSIESLGRKFKWEVLQKNLSVPEVSEMITHEEEHRAVMDARNEMAKEALASMSSAVNEFIGDTVATLRKEAADTVQEMLATMENGKLGVHQKTLNRLTEYIDRFKALNFAKDGELETQLEEFREQFLSMSAKEYRNDEHAKAALTEGLKALGQKTLELAEQDAAELVESFGKQGSRKLG